MARAIPESWSFLDKMFEETYFPCGWMPRVSATSDVHLSPQASDPTSIGNALNCLLLVFGKSHSKGSTGTNFNLYSRPSENEPKDLRKIHKNWGNPTVNITSTHSWDSPSVAKKRTLKLPEPSQTVNLGSWDTGPPFGNKVYTFWLLFQEAQPCSFAAHAWPERGYWKRGCVYNMDQGCNGESLGNKGIKSAIVKIGGYSHSQGIIPGIYDPVHPDSELDKIKWTLHHFNPNIIFAPPLVPTTAACLERFHCLVIRIDVAELAPFF